ncbi:agmatinase [Elusimicrobiota bacterium]
MTQTSSFNYCGLSEDLSAYKGSKIVLLPIPFDKTSSWVKGADKGPAAIIEASRYLELYDIETGSEIYKKGIYTAPAIDHLDSSAMISSAYSTVRNMLEDDKFVVVIGGEHSVSIGTIKAHAENFGDISILHLDAHLDSRDAYEGDKNSHACIMARAKEFSDSTVSVGIRSMDSSELINSDMERVFFAENIFNTDKWQDSAVTLLNENVYITIDLDVFDPSLMSSTGTPEPGGLGWYQVLEFLKKVFLRKNVVGFDVVELCPVEFNKSPDFTAAKLIYKLLSYKFSD